MTTGYAFVLFDLLNRNGLNQGDYNVEKAGVYCRVGRRSKPSIPPSQEGRRIALWAVRRASINRPDVVSKDAIIAGG